MAKQPAKAASKKEAPKQDQIKVKQIGKNFYVVVDEKKFTLINPDKKAVESLKTKVLIYNKKNTASKKQEILNIVDTKTKKEEVLTTKIKGTTNALKKERKSIGKKKSTDEVVAEPKGLVTQIEDALKGGTLSKEDTEKLKNLLVKKKEEIRNEPKPEQKGEHTQRRGESYR